MTDDELAKAYISLAAQMHTQYDSRRSLEWKMHIAVWTLLAATAYGIASLKFQVAGPWFVTALVLIVVLHSIWTIKIQRGQAIEQRRCSVYRNNAGKILEASSASKPGVQLDPVREERAAMPEWMINSFASYWWWIATDIGTTVCLAIIVALSAAAVAKQPTSDPTAATKADNASLHVAVSVLQSQQVDLQRRLDETRNLLQQQTGHNAGVGARKNPR